MKIIHDSEIIRLFLNETKFSAIKAKEISNIESVMQKQMKSSFSQEKNRNFFMKNESVFDSYFNKILGKYDKQKNNSDYFSFILRNLFQSNQENSKVFSQLKHLCYDLAQQLGKTGNIIHKIANLYNKYIKENTMLFEKIKFKENEEVKTIHKKLFIGLNEWGSQLLSQKKFVVDDMASFFHYRKHEDIQLSKLLNLKLNMNMKLKTKFDELNNKKVKLFQQKDIKKWKIDPKEADGDLNSLLQNFDKAKPLMLPKDTRPLREARAMNRYLDKHVLFEYVNFYTVSQFYIQENFLNFSTKMKQTLEKEDIIWNIFTNNNVDISQLDRESAIILKLNKT